MDETWPPVGYSSPEPYERNRLHALVIAAVVGLALFPVTWPYLKTGAVTVGADWAELSIIMGLSRDLAVRFAQFGGLLWMVSVLVIMTGIHELTHFVVGSILDLNPKYKWSEFILFKNPSVFANTTEITRKENISMLITPFILIGLASALVMVQTSGILAGTGGLILLTNSATSGLDLYHLLRIVLLPKGTLFANFEVDGKVHTEYVTPV